MIGFRLLFVSFTLIAIGLVGCASRPSFETASVPSGASETQWTDGPWGLRLRVRGDWDDVDAAVAVGVSRGEAATLSSIQGEGRREYRLLSIDDEPGVLIAQLVVGEQNRAGAAAGVQIDLTCRIGRYQDEARERIILEQTQQRLKNLAGVDYRPIR
jgi:hypothetical protein